jgi:PAS domain S-box-containing protein
MGDGAKHERGAEAAGLTPREREVLEEASAALAEHDGRLGDEVLQRVRSALSRVVPFERMAINVDDEGGRSFWVLWRHPPPSTSPPTFGTGIHIPRDDEYVARVGRGPHEIHVAEDVPETGTFTERALHQAGVRSFLVVPLSHGSHEVGWLTLAHDVRGAPSQAALPLLRALATLLAPPLVLARELARGKLFATLVADSPDGMLVLDRVGTVVEANRAALRLLGADRAAVLGRPVGDLVGPEVAAALSAPWSEEAGQTVHLAIEERDHRVAIDVVLARTDGSTEAAFQVHLRDARERRAAEEIAARRVAHLAFLRGLSEAMAGDLRLHTALESAATFCMTRAEVGGILMFRAEGEASLRLVAARGVGDRTKRRLALVKSKDLENALDQAGADVRRAHGVVEAVGVAIDPETTGEVPRWKILVPLAHARRPLGAMLILGQAGAELAESERDLWESVAGTVAATLHAADDFERVVALEAEKRQLVDSLPVIVARIDPKTGATTFVNGAIERVLGYTVEEAQGLPGIDGLLADPVEWEASALVRDAAARGRESSWQERKYRHKDGRILTLRESVYPVRDTMLAVRAIEVIAYDVTTELESRKQLMQSDRLASLGALAGGIAHEINNPVAFIGLAAGQITRLLETGRGEADTERAKELLKEVGEAAGRIATIVGELKLFTRIPEGAHVTPVDVNRIVQMAVTLTTTELRRRASVEVNLGELPLVPGEYASLGQAFVNLLLNAAQAIGARHEPSPLPNIVRVATFVETGAIIIRVSDTGVGIEPRILPRIFDPFFKTHAAGEGAGLGLAIAHNIVRRVGGDIRVSSVPGEGSTFDVVLPVRPPIEELASRTSPSSVMRAASISPEGKKAHGRVLIVDDEQALAKALARQLAERWDVDAVSTARDALVELSLRRYDAIACDLRMPDESGPAIYEAVRARSPRQAARFIFTTGGSFGTGEDPIHEHAQATGRPILEKPFDGATFEALVARVAAQRD